MPLATPDYSDGATNSGETVQVLANSAFNTCPAGQVGVRTYDTTNALSNLGFTIAFM